MPLPEPKPGLVVRYDYLWAREASSGRETSKDRPTCIVAASDDSTRPRYVVLLPITHTPPADGVTGIEIPAKVKRAIGLDEAPSWVVVSEYNVDEWPNGGLSPLPGQPGVYAFGFLPPGLFSIIRSTFLRLSREGAAEKTRR